jgi:hypothetical protein
VTVAGITVTSPNGGETWKRSTKNVIGWSFTGNPGKYVKIELMKAGKAVSTITKSTAIGSGEKGSFTWLVPAKLSLGSDYSVRVTSTSCASCADSSDGLFAIAR